MLGFRPYRTAIANNRPVGILLVANILNSWHWVMGVGYRHCNTTNITHFQVVDGWNARINRFYRPGHGSGWFSGTQYFIN